MIIAFGCSLNCWIAIPCVEVWGSMVLKAEFFAYLEKIFPPRTVFANANFCKRPLLYGPYKINKINRNK